jgi:hypothetical protein
VIVTDGVHMAATESLAELHRFAGEIGLNRCHYRRGHYDLPRGFFKRAVDHGAMRADARTCARARAATFYATRRLQSSFALDATKGATK